MKEFGEICWYCYWGWPKPVAGIYKKALCDRYHGKLYFCQSFTPEIKVEVIRGLKGLFKEIIDNPPGETVQYDDGSAPPDYSFSSLFLP